MSTTKPTPGAAADTGTTATSTPPRTPRTPTPAHVGEPDHVQILGYEKIKDRGWFTGRAGLIVPLLMAATATYMLIGQFTMDVPEDADKPGPQFFPWLIIAALYVLAALLAGDIIRKPQPPPLAHATQPEDLKEHAWYSDWTALMWALGGLVLFTALIMPVGWILSAALLFVTIAHAIGSRKWLLDTLVGLFLSSTVYLIFAVLLSVDLPTGLIFGSIFAGGR